MAGGATAARSGNARSGKSQAAFRTISEVSEELDVAQHVLRFWESKFPQVRPIKRGGGRRYYRPEDIDTLRDIRALLYDEGYTIKGAQRLLRQRKRPKETLRPQASASDEEMAGGSDETSLAVEGDGRERLQALRDGLMDVKRRIDRLREEL